MLKAHYVVIKISPTHYSTPYQEATPYMSFSTFGSHDSAITIGS